MSSNFWNSILKHPKTCFALLALFFVLRLYHINSPLVDHHSWNQVSAASMAKHLSYDWGTFLQPTVDQYQSLQSTSTVYAQELPLYHVPIALMYQVFGVSEWPGRIVSIIYGLLGLWFWYLLSLRLFGKEIATLTLLIAGLSPLNWYFQRTVMTDNSMVTAMIAGFYYFYLWLEDQNRQRYFWYSLLWTMAAGLFKTYGLVIGVSYLSLILLRKEYHLLKSPKLYFYVILVWLPSLLWISHVLGGEEGRTEFSNANQILHPELLWDWKFYNRIIFSRFIDQGLTPWMGAFAIVGLVNLRWKKAQHHAVIAWLLSGGIYVLFVQRGNYVHDYYQLLFVPGLASLAALGVFKFFQWERYSLLIRQRVFAVFAVLFLIHATSNAYNHTRYDIGSYNVGMKIAELSTSPEDKVLSFDIGANKHNQLVYYSEHKGWHVKVLKLEELDAFREHGARWLGVNILQESHYPKFQKVLETLENTYPKVWEDRTSKDRYGRLVLSQVYHLAEKK